jgi:HEPN domain-containing protein
VASQSSEPKTPEEWIKRFLKAAQQRYTTSEHLNDQGMYVDQMYLTGYVVECALKALILKDTPDSDRQAALDDLRRGAAAHDYERLKGIYQRGGRQFPLEGTKILRRPVKYHWTTALRYQVGRGNREEASTFLRDAKEFLEWVERRQ